MLWGCLRAALSVFPARSLFLKKSKRLLKFCRVFLLFLSAILQDMDTGQGKGGFARRIKGMMSEKELMLVLSLAVGIACGLAAVALKLAIEFIHKGITSWFDGEVYNSLYLVYPGLGMLLAMLFVRYVIRDNIGHGVTKVLLAVSKNEKVLVLLTDMTNYADALAIVSNRMDQIPSKDSMPGSLYSDLAKIYEKAVQFPAGGSITIIAVTTLSGGDITHAVPDNTGYITEGQLYLRRDSDVGKVIVDPFRSLSRLKQLVTGKKTREDHPQVMNAAVRLYADAANAKTKMENGFDLTDYDNRTLSFAKDYSEKLLAIDVNLDTTEMLDVAWSLFAKYFSPAEVNIKQVLVDKYWKKQ